MRKHNQYENEMYLEKIRKRYPQRGKETIYAANLREYIRDLKLITIIKPSEASWPGNGGRKGLRAMAQAHLRLQPPRSTKQLDGEAPRHIELAIYTNEKSEFKNIT